MNNRISKLLLSLWKYKYRFLIVSIIIFVLVVYFYQNCFSVDSNFVVASATFLLAFIAYIQLSKIAYQNEAQIIFHLEEEWHSKEMLSKRKETSKLFLNYFKNKDYIKKAEPKEWSQIQEKVEYILDFYEKIGIFYRNKSLSISAIYDLYSYYIQGCWELADKSGFIERDKKDHKGGKDFYTKTEELYKAVLKEGNLKPFTENMLKKFCEEENAEYDGGIFEAGGKHDNSI